MFEDRSKLKLPGFGPPWQILRRLPKVEARCVSQILSRRLISRAAGYSAKSVSWMLEREASIFCVWLVRLDIVKAKRFCIEPK